MNKPRVAFIFTEWNVNEYRRANNAYGGIGYYRIVKPAQYLSEWFDVSVYGREIADWGDMLHSFSRLMISHDLIYIKQVDNGPTASSLLALAKHYGRKVIVDIDDNYLSIREDNPAFKHYDIGQKERYYLGAFLSLADGLVVSTEPLKEAYQHVNPKIDVLPNCNDTQDWPSPKKWDDGKIRIGYAGSVTHNSDLELVWEPLKEILQKYPHVEFEMLGAAPKDQWDKIKKKFRSVRGKVKFHLGTPSWQGYPELLASMGWDIGIAPLIDDEFNRGKSHIKWMEYAMMEMPTVASKTYPYFMDIQDTKTIEHEKTGLLCETKEDWINSLTRLIEDESLRNTLAENAYKHIKDNWQWKQHAHKWASVINKYLNAVQ
jgi:glycosyltransferase involved in cell wall biosynthesis